MERPILTASDDRIYGETPEDGLIARVYGDPALASLFAAAPELLAALKELAAIDHHPIHAAKVARAARAITKAEAA